MSIDNPGSAAVTGLGLSGPPLGRNRSVWTVADQLVSSSQSLIISLFVTHAANAEGVGAFAVAFALYQVISAVNRPLNGDPLTVGFSAASRAEQRRAAASATGGAIVLGLFIVALGVPLGSAIGGPIGRVLMAFTIGVPAVLLQDVWRLVFFTMGRPARALTNDVIVLLALPAACLIALGLAPHSATALVAAWCAATAVGAVAGAWQSGVIPNLALWYQWWRSTLHFGAKVLGENLVANFAYAAGLTSIAAVSGVAALGRLRTAQVASNAANTVTLGIATVILAEGTRFLANAPRRFPRLILAGAGLCFTVSSGVAVAWWLVPTRFGKLVIGPSWPQARPLVLGAGAYVAAVGVATVLSAALRAMRFPSRALKTRCQAAPLTVAAAVAGAVAWGPGGAIAGIAAAEWTLVALMIPHLRRLWRDNLWQSQPPVNRQPVGP